MRSMTKSYNRRSQVVKNDPGNAYGYGKNDKSPSGVMGLSKIINSHSPELLGVPASCR